MSTSTKEFEYYDKIWNVNYKPYFNKRIGLHTEFHDEMNAEKWFHSNEDRASTSNRGHDEPNVAYVHRKLTNNNGLWGGQFRRNYGIQWDSVANCILPNGKDRTNIKLDIDTNEWTMRRRLRTNSTERVDV